LIRFALLPGGHGIFLRKIQYKTSAGILGLLLLVGLATTGGVKLWFSLDKPPARSSTGAQPADADGKYVSLWKPLFKGIEACRAWTDHPRLMKIYAVRIDLHEPSIRFLVTPSNGKAPKDCAARTTSQFLHEFGCQAAINGSVFSGPFDKQGDDPLDVLGLSLSRGEVYSPPNCYDALLIDKNNHPRIDPSPVDPKNAYNGLSGFYVLLCDGENKGDDESMHPRSVVGISRDYRYLLLMVIDGRQGGYSESATTAEAAEWARLLGAYNALNLDGGGSTTLVVEGADGRPEVLNRPSGQYERRVANHLGVYADPLD